MMPKKNPLEWSVFALSVLLVAATVGTLAVAAVRPSSSPADLRVVTGQPFRSHGGRYAVPVTVRNDGGTTAEQVAVEVVLHVNGREEERVELTVPFVPRRSAREVQAIFTRDPRCCELTARPLGFEQP